MTRGSDQNSTNAKNKTTVLITGATGFVGKQLLRHLHDRVDYLVRAAVRRSNNRSISHQDVVFIDDISATTDWRMALNHCNVIIHAAARAHVMKETIQDPLAEYRKINVEGTINLAKQAVQQGVKRFIFISSIKVNGEETKPGYFYCPDDSPKPQDPYAISKCEAEKALLALSKETGLEVVIIRPPLIYGPGVKGNFPRMISWLKKGYPLPFGLINNKRSLVSIYNLVDLIIRCIDHPQAANQVFLVSDGEDVSIVKLLRSSAQVLDKRVYLLPIPYWALNLLGKMTGTQQSIQRLCGSLQVDISKTRTLLNWQPVVDMEAALQKTVCEEQI